MQNDNIVYVNDNITFLTVTTVSFNQSTYTVYEEDRYVYIGLVLSDMSSVDVAVQLVNEDITASELCILYYVIRH